ncbi:MAG: glycosyltransferase family 4 protein [Prevotella sp.]|nr:glycosyltransferase family 4 protein [Prevotella sp.]
MKKIIRASTIPLSLNIFCRDTLREMSKLYDVVALSSSGDLLDEVEQREGVRAIRIEMERRISPIKDLVSLFKIIKVFRKEKPYIVHSMTPKAGLLCMMAAWLTRVPLRIHTFTGLVFPSTTGIKRQILMFTDRITCLCATHVIPEGEGVRNDLQDNHITKKPMQVLGYGNVRGVDMNYYSRRPDVVDFANKLRDESLTTFLFVGRIGKDKGLEELCIAFNNLWKERKYVRLWIVGMDDSLVDPITNETRNLMENHERIEAVGMKRDTELLAYYAAADCFVLPSYREGFPNTVLEAGAMDLPSIVTDINGSREIIIEGENGIIIPTHDTNALYKAMKAMVDNPQQRKAMASKARDLVSTRFEQGYVRKCLFDFYDKIIRESESSKK